jgi:hypothetical protein
MRADGSSVMYTGRAAVDMHCHGVVYNKENTGVVMRQVHKPNQVGEYKISEHHTGYPGQQRDHWTIADTDVGDADPTNTKVLARDREMNATIVQQGADHLQPATNALTLPTTGGKRARPATLEDEVNCRIHQRWMRTELRNYNELHYTDLQTECKAHHISQTGTKKEMCERLKAHYELHVQRAERSMGSSLAKMFRM